MLHLKAILLCLLPLIAYGQHENFSENMPFFLKKAKHYQRWLDTTGLGKALRVEKIQFPKDKQTGKYNYTELELFLLMQTTDLDSAVALWNQVQKDFEQTSGRPLMETLLRSYVHAMEIPSAQGNIQIHVNDSYGQRIPCFFVWIWDENGYIMDSLRVNACRAQRFDFTVPSVKIKKVLRNGRTITVDKQATVDEVFNGVLQFVRERFPRNKYEGTECSGRFPEIIEESRNQEQLIFSISDLCREALTNGSLSLWCDVARKTGWEKDCNDIRRERLTFSIKYIDGKNGYHLLCQLNGKFGSAAFQPRANDYFEMDPDFITFEKDFADRFKRALEQYLGRL